MTKYLGMLAIVFQEKKITEEFVVIYYDMLKHFPDHALESAAKECLLYCRFFPTIAEIRERAEMSLQKYNLEHRRLLTNNVYSKCHEHVYRDKNNTPRCRLEDTNPHDCELAGDGRCGKWKEELFEKNQGS